MCARSLVCWHIVQVDQIQQDTDNDPINVGTREESWIQKRIMDLDLSDESDVDSYAFVVSGFSINVPHCGDSGKTIHEITRNVTKYSCWFV